MEITEVNTIEVYLPIKDGKTYLKYFVKRCFEEKSLVKVEEQIEPIALSEFEKIKRDYIEEGFRDLPGFNDAESFMITKIFEPVSFHRLTRINTGQAKYTIADPQSDEASRHYLLIDEDKSEKNIREVALNLGFTEMIDLSISGNSFTRIARVGDRRIIIESKRLFENNLSSILEEQQYKAHQAHARYW